jgi:hypothetical protein
MERKFGIAVLAAVITFAIVFFGLSTYSASLIGNGWSMSPQNFETGYSLKQNAMVFSLIASAIVAGLTLMLAPGSTSPTTVEAGVPVSQGQFRSGSESKDEIQGSEKVKRLQELDKLRTEKLITEDEYQQRRTAILDQI